MSLVRGYPLFKLGSLGLAALKRLPVGARHRAAISRLDMIRFVDQSWASTERVELLRILGASIGDNVKIKAAVYIEYPENLTIGFGVSVQHFCVLSCYGGLEIGDNVSIAHGVSIVTSAHPYGASGPIREAELESGKVRIGSNVWIGMKASILHGIDIGSDVVVGAHALVTRSIPDNSVSTGVPARITGKVYEK